MKSFETDIQKLVEKTRLKAVEREMVRERILSYMEYHPLKKVPVEVGVLSRLKEQDFIYIHLSNPLVKIVSGLLLFFVVIGIPLIAERTVPGDTLYLIKTGINESIRTQLATSPYAKVQLETKLMERRISEARLLASEGKLTEEVEAQIAKTVRGHAAAVQDGIAELRVDDAEGAALAEIVFNSALEVQSAVLDEENEASSTQGDTILEAVNTVRNDVATDANPVAPSFDGIVARIESETTRSYELFETVKLSATNEEVADIERRLGDIDRSILGARELKENDETAAVVELVDVLGLIQKLIAFMTDIDVRETVALETLVPMKLTDEERIGYVQVRLGDIEEQTKLVTLKIETIEDEALVEKIALSLTHAYELTLTAKEALLVRNIGTAESQSLEAEAIIADLVHMTADIVAPAVPPEEILVPEFPDGEHSTTSPTSSTTPTTTLEVTSTTTIGIDVPVDVSGP